MARNEKPADKTEAKPEAPVADGVEVDEAKPETQMVGGLEYTHTAEDGFRRV